MKVFVFMYCSCRCQQAHETGTGSDADYNGIISLMQYGPYLSDCLHIIGLYV